MPATPKAEKTKFDPAAALLVSFATNENINQFLLENLSADAWRAEPPNGKGRTIAGIVAHIHNVRVMWLKSGKGDVIPEQLDRHMVTVEEARAGLEQSYQAVNAMIARALETDGRIRGFRPDVRSESCCTRAGSIMPAIVGTDDDTLMIYDSRRRTARPRFLPKRAPPLSTMPTMFSPVVPEATPSALKVW